MIDFLTKLNTESKCFQHFMKIKYNNKFPCSYCSKKLYDNELWVDTNSNKTTKSNTDTNTKDTTLTIDSNNSLTQSTPQINNSQSNEKSTLHPDTPFMKRYFRKDPKTWKRVKKNNYVYICSKCKKQASPFKGTIFHHTKIPLQKRFIAIHYITSWKKWFPALQLHREIWVNYKTAFRMIHSIRGVMLDNMNLLEGVVEIDEAFISNKKKKSLAVNKTFQGRSSLNKRVIIAIYSRRTKQIILHQVENVDEKTVLWLINKYVKVGSRIMTDEWWSYKNLRIHWYIHWTTNHNKWEYAKSFDIHSNMPETFRGSLKWWLWVVYQGVSKGRLNNYLKEFSWRFNNRNNVKSLFDYVLLRV